MYVRKLQERHVLFSFYFQLDCGAKVTAKGIDQMTPLSVAAQKGSADIMALFFKKCTYVNNRACLLKITIGYVATYNTRHKSLKQEPFVLNFVQIPYIHS